MKKLAVLASVFPLLAMPVLARQYGPIVVDDWSGKFVVTSKGVPAGVAANIAQLAAPAAPTPADIVWQPAPHNNWDTASQVVINGKPYYPESAEKPHSIQIAKNTTADLTRFEIRHGDLWTQALGGNDSERAELDGYASLFNAGQDFWFAYDLKAENGVPWIAAAPGGGQGGPGAWLTLGQIHGKGNASAVPWGLSGKGEKFRITTQTGAQVEKVHWTSPKIVRDKIYRIVGRINISGNRAVDSSLDVWVDGVQVVNFVGKIGDVDPKYYFKFGCYRGWENEGLPTMAFQYANVVQGTASLLSRVTSPPPWPGVK
jgi:hypothetical protein